MIRILHFGLTSNYGGVEAFVMNYYRAIDKSKYQFDFVKSSSESKIAYEDEILALGGKVYVRPSVRLRNGYFKLRKAWREFYRAANIDEIHVNTIGLTSLLIIRFAKEMGIHVHVHVHAHPSSYDAGFSLFDRIRMKVNKKLIHRYADTLLACSNDAGKWMYGSDYIVIPNSIDFDKFSYNEEKRLEIRKKYGVENSFLMLNVGRISVVKNQMFLLDVLAELKKRRTDAKLMIVGADALDGELNRKAESMELADDVICTGMVENPEVYYSAGDVFVFPSLSEGFGIVAIEAQANGLIGVVSNRVIKDLNLSNALHYLTIDNSDEINAAELWTTEIVRINRRLNEKEIEAVRSVYDINLTVKVLEKIYSENE